MLVDLPTKIMKRKRQQSVALSNEMIKEIKKATQGCISVSGFIRMAVKKELERK